MVHNPEGGYSTLDALWRLGASTQLPSVHTPESPWSWKGRTGEGMPWGVGMGVAHPSSGRYTRGCLGPITKEVVNRRQECLRGGSGLVPE